MTVMFADMASSVARTHDLHPEEAVRLVNRLLERMASAVEEYGGRVDRYLGDGMLAVFGAPRRHEDDAERAVRAALNIIEAAAELDLAATVGINSGEVFFGDVGGAAHRETTVMGSVVNLAARLQGAASAGEIVLGEATVREVEAVVHGEARTIAVKGIPEPVDAMVVTGLSEDPQRRSGVRSRLVGREQELETLVEAVRDAARGVPSMVAVTAEAGVGKSRLIEELADRVGDEVRWLAGRCADYLRQTAYAPFSGLLADRHGLAPEGAERLRAEMLALEAAGLLAPGSTDDLARFLVDLIPAGSNVRAVDPISAVGDDRRSLTFLAMTDYLRALDREQPVVVVIEDLHWADDLSRQLIGHLSDHLDGSRLTLLVATRSDGRSLPGPDAARLVEISLAELDGGSRNRLLATLLGSDDVPDEVVAAVTSRAQGNPLFIEEVVRDLIEQRALTRTGDTWHLDLDDAGTTVPTSVGAVVLSRVDRLAPEVRRMAEAAAVIGRSFRLDVLGEVVQGDLEAGIRDLIDAGLVVEESAAPNRVVAFHHALGQEAVYGSLLPSRRQTLHAHVAERLSDTGATASVIAFHWERSGDDARAADALLAAAREASGAFMLDTALDLLDRAEARGAAVGAWPGRLATLEERAAALERLDQRPEARAVALEALALAEDPLVVAGLRSLIGRTHILDHDMDRAHEMFDLALGGLGEVDGHTAARWLEANHDKARGYYFSNRPDAMAPLVERAEFIVEEWGSGRERYDHQRITWMLAAGRGRYTPSRELTAVGEELVSTARASGNLIDLADATFALGFTHLWGDRPDLAHPLLVDALDMNQRVGNTVYAARAHAYVVLAARRNRDVGEVRERSEAALPAVRAAGMENYEAYIEGCLAWAGWFEGDLAAARPHVDRSLEIAARVPLEFAWTIAWPAAAVAAQAGDLPGARQALLLVETERERPRPDDLDAAVKAAITEPTRESIDLVTARAREHLQM